MNKKLAVLALGGNALLRSNQRGTIEEQEQASEDTMRNLIYLLREGYELIITHGNGPQVGNIMMQNDAGQIMYDLPAMPLDVCVADSQGSIAYIIERQLRNVLRDAGIQKDVMSIITEVMVDINDPAFKNPTKAIGKIYPKVEADKLAAEKGWIFKKSPKVDDGWRRVVASPTPLDIFNKEVIGSIARGGTIVIAAGGGGIPVYIDEKNHVRPAEAVIDKDLASALLASQIGADEFYILTDVPYVFIDFKQPTERKVEFLNKKDTDQYLADGKFGEGDMAPKIKACLSFIEKGGRKSVITEATKLEDKKYGTKITMEYED